MNGFRLRLRHKLVLSWLASSVLLTVLIGVAFAFLHTVAHQQSARQDLAAAFGMVAARLDALGSEVERAAALLADRDDVVATLHLVEDYEDPADYRPFVFDSEKARLARELDQQARAGGLDALVAYDGEDNVVSFHLSARIVRPARSGFVTIAGGRRVVVDAGHVPGGRPMPLALDRHLAELGIPAGARQRAWKRSGRQGLVVAATAPVTHLLAGRQPHVAGRVVAARLFGEDEVKAIAAATGLVLDIAPADQSPPEIFAEVAPAAVKARLESGGIDQSAPAGGALDTGAMFVTAARLPQHGDGVEWLVYAGRNKADVSADILTFEKAAAVAIVAMLVLAMPVGALLARALVARPVEALARGIDDFKLGRRRRLEGFGDDDELGRLADAFNAMAEAITEREQALEYSERRYRDLYHSAPSAYASIDLAAGTILDCNRAFETLVGRPRDAIEGARLTTLVAPIADCREVVTQAVGRAAGGDAVREVEVRITRGLGGEPAWASLTLEPGSSPAEGRLVLIDIDARKTSEAAVRRSLDALARANADLSQFARVAAHDLREPVRHLVSYTQLLERTLGDEAAANQRDYMTYIVTAARRMHALVGDLLDLCTIRTTGETVKAVDSADVLRESLEILDGALEESGAAIEVGALPVLPADRGQLRQVFAHLLGNALTYRAPSRPPHVTIGAEVHGDHWVFSVADNGIGIEPAYLQRIFEVFERLHPPERHPGTGIGLALCKRIVEGHGGRIWAESEPGLGTTVRFTLPAGFQAVPERPERAATSETVANDDCQASPSPIKRA